jgi:putative addiction module CopG family antidote
MEVELSPEQQAFIKAGIEGGRYQSSEDAIQEALRQWEDRQRTLAQLQVLVDEGMEDLERGRYNDFTDETLPELFERIKREGRRRLPRRPPLRCGAEPW